MRRTGWLVAVAIAVLALASSALALSRVLHGPAGGGSGSVDVQFTIRGAHATKITRFEFNNIPASCAHYPATAVSDTFAHAIRVSSRGRFHARETTNAGRVTYVVAGHFASLHRASGTLRVRGTVPGCLTADTGTVHWSATG